MGRPELPPFIKSGDKFGRLTVIKRSESRTSNNNALYECKCSCGSDKTVLVTKNNLIHGITRSCGCLFIETTRQKGLNSTTHGGSKDRLYGIRSGMLDRCENINSKDYKNYGQKNITVCDEWKGPNGYQAFKDWALSHGYQDSLTINRIDHTKGYCPENCEWITPAEQNAKGRSNLILCPNGQNLKAFCKENNLSYTRVRQRLVAGKDFESAISDPPIWFGANSKFNK